MNHGQPHFPHEPAPQSESARASKSLLRSPGFWGAIAAVLGLAIALGTWIDPGLWGRLLGLPEGQSPTQTTTVTAGATAASSDASDPSASETICIPEHDEIEFVLTNTMRDGECSIRSIDFDADATEDWLFDYDFVPGAELSWMLCEVGNGAGWPNMDACAASEGCAWAGDVSMPEGNEAVAVVSREGRGRTLRSATSPRSKPRASAARVRQRALEHLPV